MAERQLTGEMCASLTRIVVNRDRHDELVDALSSTFSQVRVGDPFYPQMQMGPLAARRQRDPPRATSPRASPRGATLATGGGRPKHLERGWFRRAHRVRKRRQLLDHRPGRDLRAGLERHPPPMTSDTPSTSPTTPSMASMRPCSPTTWTGPGHVARQSALRHRRPQRGSLPISGSLSVGSSSQGSGERAGREGLLPFLETKTLILEGPPSTDRSAT